MPCTSHLLWPLGALLLAIHGHSAVVTPAARPVELHFFQLHHTLEVPAEPPVLHEIALLVQQQLAVLELQLLLQLQAIDGEHSRIKRNVRQLAKVVVVGNGPLINAVSLVAAEDLLTFIRQVLVAKQTIVDRIAQRLTMMTTTTNATATTAPATATTVPATGPTTAAPATTPPAVATTPPAPTTTLMP